MRKRTKILIFAIGIGLGVFIMLFYYGFIWPTNPARLGYSVFGVNVSRLNGEIDWEILKEQNIKFAYIEVTSGDSFTDSNFEKNISAAVENGIYCGGVHSFDGESLGKSQAEFFYGKLKEQETNLPPVLHFEIGNEFSGIKSFIVDEVLGFISEIENLSGMKPIIYTDYTNYNMYLRDGFSDYEFWIRDFLKEPELDDDWIFWQYKNRGIIKGFDSKSNKRQFVELNVFKFGFDEFEKYTEKRGD